jgi:hypothetical protein
VVRRSTITSRDVFWHARDVLVEDCQIETEYLAWHARNVTFVRCSLQGPQPLCYATGLVLRSCSLVDADRAFEYSDVDAEITGHVDSVLNPRSGRIVAGSIGTLRQDDPDLDPQRVVITTISPTAGTAREVGREPDPWAILGIALTREWRGEVQRSD